MRKIVSLGLGLMVLALLACAGSPSAKSPILDLLGEGGRLNSEQLDAIKRAQGAPAPAAEQPRAFPTPAPFFPLSDAFADESTASSRPSPQTTPSEALPKTALLTREAALALPAQARLIVRTVEMTLVVEDVARTMQRVGSLADAVGGWVVSSKRTERHRGLVSIRVPVAQVEETLRSLRALAIEQKAEVSTSQDVSDEFVDIESRIRNLQATAAQLLKLLERPGPLKDILEIQRELTTVQGEIERLQGRNRFLQETAAYSLINVSLVLASATFKADAGTDRVIAEGEPLRFRANFTPPEGITTFTYRWDFGDSTASVSDTRTVPTGDGKVRATQTVTHSYRDDLDSPFIVTFSITGTGEAGIAEGEDTLVATVTSVPNIQVSAGEGKSVKAEEVVTFTGTLTRPEGVTGLTYRWDFGDGLEPEEGAVPAGATTVTAQHLYSLTRAALYTVTLTVTGKTSYEATVKASDKVSVQVIPASPWFTRVWDLDETARAAVRALSATAQTLAAGGLWVIVFSPLWLAGIAVGLVARRLRNRIIK